MKCFSGLLVILMLVSCGYQYVKPNQGDNITSNQTEVAEILTSTTEYPDVYTSDHVALESTDFEIVYTMCKSLLFDYYNAKADPTKSIDFSKYIQNPNLIKYSIKKFQVESHPSVISNIKFGLIEAQLRKGNQFYLHLTTVVSGEADSQFSETTEFLVTIADGKFIVADWFFPYGTVSFYDDSVREQSNLNNIHQWEDKEFVSNIFMKAGITE